MSQEDKEALMQRISEQISKVRDKKENLQRKSLSRYAPEKVAEILYLFSTGSSQTKIVKKYGFGRETVISVLIDYADAMGTFKELSGTLSAKNYMNLSSLEEDLIEKVRERMDTDPEMQVSFRDLKELSIAKANASREALTARGESSTVVESKHSYTIEDFNETLSAARKRIEEAKVAEVIEIQDS
tara:strand:- start:5167 stop:5724 length:558 start_codon:yes stop_codon:yes gene_type:complete